MYTHYSALLKKIGKFIVFKGTHEASEVPISRGFLPCPFPQIFCSRIFLTVKHRQHRIKLIRNRSDSIASFSYANKFGEIFAHFLKEALLRYDVPSPLKVNKTMCFIESQK
jgi:hypothetical protein